MKLTTIFSTGDAGAARGALEAADELKLKVGGWTAVNGLPAICTERLKPTLAPRMAARLNVQDSDGTLIVSFSTSLAAGSPAAYADEAAAQQRKASLHLVLPDRGRTTIPEDVRKGVVAWIAEERIATLHVTGPREAEEPGIQQAVRDALVWIFEDEVQPRPKFDGVDRTAPPEPLRSYDELERLAAELAAMPSPTHIAINPENVDAAIAAGLDVQWLPPSLESAPPVREDREWRAPPPVPPEVWAARDRLLGEAHQPYGISPALAAVATAKQKIDAVNAAVNAAVGDIASSPAFYLHRLDICHCGRRRGDHDGTTGCAFVLAKAHDPRAKPLEVAQGQPPADEA